MPQLRVLLGFASAPDNSLDELAGVVLLKLYGNPVYPTPPVTSANLTLGRNNFTNAVAAADIGGPIETATKNNLRGVLIDQLRQLAGYVQERHGNDMAKLLSSGFEAVSSNRASTPLDQSTLLAITNGGTGQLLLRVAPQANAKCYEARYALISPSGTPGDWQPGGLHTNSRNLPINGLIPGGNYTFTVRAIGGSTGYSDWSDPVSHRSL
jgi:hypothetical protein